MLAAGGALLVALVAIMAVVAISSDSDPEQRPITTLEAGDRKVHVYAPGTGQRTYVTTSNAAEGQVTIRTHRIVMRRDGSVHLDGRKLDLIGFTELEIVVHPDQRVETRVLKARSGSDDPLAQSCCSRPPGTTG